MQSKKGSLWSRKSLGVETFSSVFTFRISGQGKKFFGDGMALWFIKQVRPCRRGLVVPVLIELGCQYVEWDCVRSSFE